MDANTTTVDDSESRPRRDAGVEHPADAIDATTPTAEAPLLGRRRP